MNLVIMNNSLKTYGEPNQRLITLTTMNDPL